MPRYRVHTAYTTPLANYVDAYSGFFRGAMQFSRGLPGVEIRAMPVSRCL